MPKSGDFVGMSLVVKVNDEVLLDTKATKRPIAFTFGKKPYVSLVCGGLEEGLSTMRRGGVQGSPSEGSVSHTSEKLAAKGSPLDTSAPDRVASHGVVHRGRPRCSPPGGSRLRTRSSVRSTDGHRSSYGRCQLEAGLAK